MSFVLAVVPSHPFCSTYKAIEELQKKRSEPYFTPLQFLELEGLLGQQSSSTDRNAAGSFFQDGALGKTEVAELKCTPADTLEACKSKCTSLGYDQAFCNKIEIKGGGDKFSIDTLIAGPATIDCTGDEADACKQKCKEQNVDVDGDTCPSGGKSSSSSGGSPPPATGRDVELPAFTCDAPAADADEATKLNAQLMCKRKCRLDGKRSKEFCEQAQKGDADKLECTGKNAGECDALCTQKKASSVACMEAKVPPGTPLPKGKNVPLGSYECAKDSPEQECKEKCLKTKFWGCHDSSTQSEVKKPEATLECSTKEPQACVAECKDKFANEDACEEAVTGGAAASGGSSAAAGPGVDPKKREAAAASVNAAALDAIDGIQEGDASSGASKNTDDVIKQVTGFLQLQQSQRLTDATRQAGEITFPGGVKVQDIACEWKYDDTNGPAVKTLARKAFKCQCEDPEMELSTDKCQCTGGRQYLLDDPSCSEPSNPQKCKRSCKCPATGNPVKDYWHSKKGECLENKCKALGLPVKETDSDVECVCQSDLQKWDKSSGKCAKDADKVKAMCADDKNMKEKSASDPPECECKENHTFYKDKSKGCYANCDAGLTMDETKPSGKQQCVCPTGMQKGENGGKPTCECPGKDDAELSKDTNKLKPWTVVGDKCACEENFKSLNLDKPQACFKLQTDGADCPPKFHFDKTKDKYGKCVPDPQECANGMLPKEKSPGEAECVCPFPTIEDGGKCKPVCGKGAMPKLKNEAETDPVMKAFPDADPKCECGENHFLHGDANDCIKCDAEKGMKVSDDKTKCECDTKAGWDGTFPDCTPKCDPNQKKVWKAGEGSAEGTCVCAPGYKDEGGTCKEDAELMKQAKVEEEQKALQKQMEELQKMSPMDPEMKKLIDDALANVGQGATSTEDAVGSTQVFAAAARGLLALKTGDGAPIGFQLKERIMREMEEIKKQVQEMKKAKEETDKASQ
uniref:Uncharacterized protein n=1 Tax=Chromera velia CCMP2878 TaxID=1169474 RepID=A0A0G4HU63_9ALVE|eukprot:Cvel_8551.t1-p1 / transcript=Cvel_8551.t1 / gene=Cvel_8551 / organism=Chromera_velia_CCMP2878 / gene_product=Cell death abnormality protein 1, putative / transcript_product=Cell death abnormality protein 1, putative / location=Cvel_scaffold474:25125-39840(-) / protein_length=972 / sequence_SO=supercontig / SO=protein_coding / is_pseudo=false